MNNRDVVSASSSSACLCVRMPRIACPGQRANNHKPRTRNEFCVPTWTCAGLGGVFYPSSSSTTSNRSAACVDSHSLPCDGDWNVPKYPRAQEIRSSITASHPGRSGRPALSATPRTYSIAWSMIGLCWVSIVMFCSNPTKNRVVKMSYFGHRPHSRPVSGGFGAETCTQNCIKRACFGGVSYLGHLS